MLTRPRGTDAEADREGADESEMLLTAHDTRFPIRVDVAALKEPGYSGNREFLGERIEPLLEAMLTASEHHGHYSRAHHKNRQRCPQ